MLRELVRNITTRSSEYRADLNFAVSRMDLGQKWTWRNRNERKHMNVEQRQEEKLKSAV